MTDLFRLYKPSECGADGYPFEWHEVIKQTVRAEAGNRCIRCKHPYECGAHGSGEWSTCDELCDHDGPLRIDDRVVPPSELGFVAGVIAEAQWRILTVHHLDGNKANCRWWNLVALCQRCHLTIQSKVNMSQVWPYEHSEWFKFYAAGYYALHYLGEELTREQTEARWNELLALERMA